MKEKRIIKNYRIRESHYVKAQSKAAKTDKPLAERIEDFVLSYAGIEKTSYCAAMGELLIKSSNKKKK